MKKFKIISKTVALFAAVCMILSAIPVFAVANPDTSTWFPYIIPTPDDVEGTPLDASGILDGPAGKHGFLTDTDNADFVFEDGTKIKFFGVNITGETCYPSYENSVNLAKRIAQSGFNMVRIHLVDSGNRDGIWGRKADGGRVINPGAMDRLCFLMNELKKRGIYIWIDQVLSRPSTIDDEFADMEALGDGLKGYSYFDPQLLQFQKDFATMMFNWYNPYSGVKLKDDPSIAIVEFKNEDALTSFRTNNSPTYHAQIEKMFNEWLVKKYGTRDNLINGWRIYTAAESNNKVVLEGGEDPVNGTVKFVGNEYDAEVYSARRQKDIKEFVAEIQANYFNQMRDHLRSLGVKCRISAISVWI